MTEATPEFPEVRHIPDDVLGKSPEIMTEAEKIAAALDMASSYGDIEGDHHKMWTIDQIVRILTGCPLVKSEIRLDVHDDRYTYDKLGESEAYLDFVARHDDIEGNGPKLDFWDTGTAP